MHEKNMNNFT